MKAEYRRVPTRFGPETRFELRPAPLAPFRATEPTELERLKNRLLLERLEETEPGLGAYLRRAANEAAALAWVTAFPLLVFPGLFEEKAAVAARQVERQDNIRRRSLELLVV